MTHPLATARGKRLRDAVLLRDQYTCQMCGVLVTSGRKAPTSAVVDHIRPISLRPDLTWDMGNCRVVCRQCHAVCDSIEKRAGGDADEVARAKLAYRAVGLDGYPIRTSE